MMRRGWAGLGIVAGLAVGAVLPTGQAHWTPDTSHCAVSQSRHVALYGTSASTGVINAYDGSSEYVSLPYAGHIDMYCGN